jgi:uncharacterized delta-60 repeat protein
MRKYFLLFTSLLFIQLHVYSQSGILDPTFGSGGKIKTNFTAGSTTGSERAAAAAVQADGKLLVAATGSGSNVVLRYNTNGTIDNTFDGDGMAGLYGLTPTSLAIGSDGKIVVGGYVGSSNDYAVVRLHSDGTVDNTFDGDGRAVTTIGASTDQITGVAIQTDGKIVAAGYTYNGANTDWAIVRYNSNGSLDNTFDSDGKLITTFGSGNDEANAVALQSDGKIIVAGYGTIANAECAVVRLNTDGTFDNTFDGDGKVITSINTLFEEFSSIVIQPDGKIVIGGAAYIGGYTDLLLVRYNSNGSLDNTFDGDGFITTPVGSSGDVINGLTIQADGKLVAAGYAGSGMYTDSYTARFNTNGSLDNTYDGDGKKMVALSATDDQYVGVVMQSGKIVAVGQGVITNYDFIITRYNTDGTLDNTFNGTGQLNSGYGGSSEQLLSMVIQPDGKLIAAGTTTVTNADFVVARYNSDGTADNTFDSDGRVVTNLGSGNDQAMAVAVQSDGKIVAAGYFNNGSNNDFALVRYNANGSIDNSFSGDGIVTHAIGASGEQINAIAIQPDGKIVVAGTAVMTNNDFAVARYNTDGSLDVTFDSDGIVTTAVGASTDQANGIVLQPDGKIVVVGTSSSDFAVVRYNTDGSIDLTFDADGKATTPIGVSTDVATGVDLQTDGKIVVGGYANMGTNDFAVARYNTDGSLDATFDSDGKATTAIGLTTDVASAIDIAGDGKIILAGYSYNGLNNDFALVRYNTDGSPDNTFGVGGKATFDLFTGAADAATAAKIYGDLVYLGGTATTELGQDFTLAAVLSPQSALPLELLSFTGNINNGAAHLIWQTTNERNTLEFVIEKSLDGVVYVDAGTVPSVNNPGNHTYTFTDPNIGTPGIKKIYYRLKQKDIDGQFTYSGIVTLTLAGNGNIVRLTPNPVDAMASLMITAAEREAITYLIIDSKGSIIKTVKTALTPGSNRITINMSDLKTGTYTLDVRGTVTKEQLRFLKR